MSRFRDMFGKIDRHTYDCPKAHEPGDWRREWVFLPETQTASQLVANQLMLAGDGRSLHTDLVCLLWAIAVAGFIGSRESDAPTPIECAPPEVPGCRRDLCWKLGDGISGISRVPSQAASGLIHSRDSQIARSSSSSRHESWKRGERHA
jgi:hypothetical protein